MVLFYAVWMISRVSHLLRASSVGLAFTALCGTLIVSTVGAAPARAHAADPRPNDKTASPSTRTTPPPKRPAAKPAASRAPIGAQATATLGNVGTVTASPVSGRVGNTTASASPDNQVGPGDTVHWVLDYLKTSPGPASASITDLFDKSRQTFVPGSLDSPPGSTNSWSTDGGASFLPTDQGTATDGVRVVRPDVDASTTIPAPPAGGFSAASGGDGYNVAFFGNNVYTIYHHNPSSIVDCHDKSTGVRCLGYTNTILGNTGQTPNAVVFGTNLFWAPVIAGRAVVQVLDLTTDTLIATIDTGPAVTIGSHNSSKDGWAVGSNFYFLSENDTINCVSMNAPFSPCPDQPYSLGLPGTPNISSDAVLADGGHLRPAGATRIYAVAARLVDAVNTNFLTCFDTATQAICAGTSAVDLTADFGSAIRSAMPFNRLSPSGGDAGVCVQPVVGITIRCYNASLVYQAADPYAALATAFPIVITWNGTGQGPAIGSKIYLPMANSGAGNDIGCFDWATSLTCANYPFTTTTEWGFATRPYTLQADPQIPNCLWENGDAGLVVPFDATTGEQGCPNTQTDAEIDAAAFFCDGQTDHITGWDTATISSTFLLPTGSIEVTVRDSNGDIVPGFDAIEPTDAGAGTWTVDLSPIPYSGATTVLTINVVVLNGDPNSWEEGDPRVAATWEGDQGMQVCFDTTVLDVCPPSPQAQGFVTGYIATAATAETTDEEGTDTVDADAAFNFLYGSDCFAYLVAKTASETTATLYQPVTYQTTVTNTGREPLTAISVRDDVTGWLPYASLVANSLTATSGTVSGPTGGTITWTGDLPVAAVVTISYEVTIIRDAPDNAHLTNTASPGQSFGTCTAPTIDAAANRRSSSEVTPSARRANGTRQSAGSNAPITAQQSTPCRPAVLVERPTLTIVKEICQSTTVANCVAGGNGPWVHETNLAHGATAYWRITVTNTSTLDITDISLADSGDGSDCAARAGTFDLAAAESRAFYCSTRRVTATTTNAVSAQFVPEFAPPGTSTLTVGPATAIATVDPPLPRTGFAVMTIVVIGVGLIGGGAIFVWFFRRPRRRPMVG